MHRLHGLSRFFLTFIGKFTATLVITLVMVGVVGLLADFVGSVQQEPAQRGIDAHTVRLIATYTGFVEGRGKFDEDTYILSYIYEDQRFETRLPSLPGNREVGDQLCVEIDGTQPEHGRVCGTHGGHDGALAHLLWAGALLAFAVVLGIVAWRAPLPRQNQDDAVAVERPRHWLASVAGNVSGRRRVPGRPHRRRNPRRTR
jgi:hypothetical protein